MEQCGLLGDTILGSWTEGGHSIAPQTPAEAASEAWHSGQAIRQSTARKGWQKGRERAWKEQEGDARVSPTPWMILDDFTQCCWNVPCNPEVSSFLSKFIASQTRGPDRLYLAVPVAPSSPAMAPTPSPGRIPLSSACIISRPPSSHLLNLCKVQVFLRGLLSLALTSTSRANETTAL